MSEFKKAALLMGAIAAAFKANKTATELLVTEDGNCFLPENKSFANAHANRNKFQVKTVSREEFEKNNEAFLEHLEEQEKEAAEKAAADAKAKAEQEAEEKEAAEKAAKEAEEKAAAEAKEKEEAEAAEKAAKEAEEKAAADVAAKSKKK